ncbi:hypothetical protein KUTeg_023641 [Tegillarca granosa]|uniref:Nuclear receptor domain-containing protein n=1 Tax=Tegillarca granosa TaxID=220873 RepID=A0ABQ9E574_TEGGR|nr:hypothetical protein KUTeg_023641 [Tegillarca granosa]
MGTPDLFFQLIMPAFQMVGYFKFKMSAESEEIPKSEVLENEDQSSNKGFLKSSPLELPPCDVCGGKASGIHYGVNSCEACKGFFRRYLSRKEPYVCNKNNKCVITDRPRGNCSACRMNKCLELGMSKEAVRQGRYTLEERTKTINAVRVLQGKDVGDMDHKFTPDYNQMTTDISPDYHMTDDIKAALDLQALSIQSQTVSSSNSASGSPSGLNSSASVSPPVFGVNSEEIKDEKEKDSKLQVILACLTEAYNQFQYPSRKITLEEMQDKFNQASVSIVFI